MKKEPTKIPLNPDTPRSKNVTLYKMPPLIIEDAEINNNSNKLLDNNENLKEGTET